MPSRSRADRARTILTVALTALVVVLTGFLAWAASPMTAEPGPLTAIRSGDLGYRETADAVVLAPENPVGTGLIFLAGARVEPAAYANKLSGLAEAGVTVVIVRPILNFAILEGRPLSTFEALAPGVGQWFVGGHSLGGVRACSYAADDPDSVAGLILFGSYCTADLSSTSTPVLTLVGQRDGLSTPATVAEAASLLPAGAQIVELPGASPAQFGDYGTQPGDGVATASDAATRAAITAATLAFLDGVAGH
jgi:pimeloyl-ACP methyl ester carboxylesterase